MLLRKASRVMIMISATASRWEGALAFATAVSMIGIKGAAVGLRV